MVESIRSGGDEDDAIPFLETDKAETFEEDGVSVETTDADVAGGSVEIQESQTGSYNTTKDASASVSWAGVTIEPNVTIGKLTVENWYDGTQKANALRVVDIDAGETVEEKTDLSIGDGESESLSNLSLDVGVQYAVEFRSPDHSRNDNPPDISGPVFDSNAGAGDGEVSDGSTFSVAEVEAVADPPPTEAEVVVGWETPRTVYDWNAATFQATEDGETVEVYVEESTDDGDSWTEIAGPISRGDEIDADPDSDVRLRVELSRENTNNNPTLDALYRRYEV